MDRFEFNNKEPGFDFDFLFLVIVSVFLFVLLFSKDLGAKEVRTLRLSSQVIGRIRVAPGRSTVLSFPARPVKVILGSQGAFAVEYVESDLAIAALKPNSKSNMFVYLDGRRFAFDLTTIPAGGDELVFVRDEIPKHSVSVKYHER